MSFSAVCLSQRPAGFVAARLRFKGLAGVWRRLGKCCNLKSLRSQSCLTNERLWGISSGMQLDE
jgi:hypothetical protein